MSEQVEASPQTEAQLTAAAGEIDVQPVDARLFKKILEAALLTAQEPLTWRN